MQSPPNRRILVVDDTPSMHQDFRKTLSALPAPAEELDRLEGALFGDTAGPVEEGFDVDSAYQGLQALALVDAAVNSGRPYAVAFVDMRMPPGWDGVETVERLWQVDPQLQVVICTAYSDHPWEEVLRRLDARDRLLVVKKPFDMIEVSQLARTLTAKWTLARQAALQLNALETIVQERTRELVAARDAAQAANRAKDEFLANMSHEIRTPMNAIMGLASLLLQTGIDAQQRDYLSKLHASAEHLLGILDDILDFSKVEAGELQVERTRFTLDSALQRVTATLSHKCAAKGLALAVDVDPDMPAQLLGDPLRLAQVLMNFVGNAIKFTERGTIRISASVQSRSPSDVVIRLSVADTGIGIAPEQQRLLFHRFQQGDASTTRKSGGTGLGLAISRQLAQLMGGEAGLESEPGKGSCFWFTARLGLPDPALAEAPGAPGARPEARQSLEGGRILLVEDNEINQLIACAFLKKGGLLVDVAENGREALERLRDASYDLVLMDIHMPVLDGLDATRIIRSQPGNANLPVIAMTASVLPADRSRCIEAGMNDTIAKPLSPNAMWDVLHRWMPPRRERSG
jgi:two-component system sensor histidine kinase/response regulator